MRGQIQILQFLSDGVAVLTYDGDRALWARAKVRKAHVCAVSDQKIESGSLAWKPVGNQQYRMKRISDEIMVAAGEMWPDLLSEVE